MDILMKLKSLTHKLINTKSVNKSFRDLTWLTWHRLCWALALVKEFCLHILLFWVFLSEIKMEKPVSFLMTSVHLYGGIPLSLEWCKSCLYACLYAYMLAPHVHKPFQSLLLLYVNYSFLTTSQLISIFLT